MQYEYINYKCEFY